MSISIHPHITQKYNECLWKTHQKFIPLKIPLHWQTSFEFVLVSAKELNDVTADPRWGWLILFCFEIWDFYFTKAIYFYLVLLKSTSKIA